MDLRLMATAFIINGSRILMLKRSKDRKLAPGLWTGVGGHIEPNELKEPRSACLREIYEETGIEEQELIHIRLRYILLRQKGTEIRQQFVYFCETEKNEIIKTEEGELHWIEIEVLNDLNKPKIIEFMLHHYYTENKNLNHVHIGTMIEEFSVPAINWVKLSDPGVV